MYLPGVVLTVARRAVVSMTTTCEAIALGFEVRLGSLRSYWTTARLRDCGVQYVFDSGTDELGERNNQNGLRVKCCVWRLPKFVMQAFASFVDLLRPPPRRSFRQVPNLRFAVYERVMLSACKVLDSCGASVKVVIYVATKTEATNPHG